MQKKLFELKKNESGVVASVNGDVHIKRRLLELGLTTGTKVKILSVSPLKNTYLIALRNYCLALRKNSLELVSVEADE
ncbi:MAG: ferrous iron transport protein A [Clostridia bacterium]|nr:ferrous iron transport protein A [Clostridia bacterium]